MRNLGSISMSEYSDRMDRIREGMNKTREYNKKKGIPVDSLPQMHKDLYWLFGIVEMHDKDIKDEQDFHDKICKCRMDYIMGND